MKGEGGKGEREGGVALISRKGWCVVVVVDFQTREIFNSTTSLVVAK